MAPKKSTKSDKEPEAYDIQDVVLGKVRGFPAWPGMIVDPETVPTSVHRERPQNKKTTFYCVRFFPVGDYAWLVSKDISRLKKNEIESYIAEPHKKTGDLLQGYRIALNPGKWQEERSYAGQDEDANGEGDQLEDGDDDDEDGPRKKPSKKRKRESEVPKPKATKSKKERDSPVPTKKKAAAKVKKNKSKATVESEDDGERDDEDAGPSKKDSQPAAKKSKKDKDGDENSALASDPDAVKVRDWRHKLQKAFLGKKIPERDDMPGLDELFTTVEAYQNMTVPYLSFSKIGKVMRHIAMLEDAKVPRNEDFRFKLRAQELVDKWHGVLGTTTGQAQTNGATGTHNGTNGGAMDEDSKSDLKNEPKDEDAAGDVEIPDADADVAKTDDSLKVELPLDEAVGDESMIGDVTMTDAGGA